MSEVTSSTSGRGELEGRVAIVAGGAGNLGRGVCRGLTAAGATVVAFDLNVDAAEGVARAVQIDLTDPTATESAVDEVVREFGGIDVLVNMAGKTIVDVPFAELSVDDLDVSFATGPVVTMRLMQLCYPHLKARGGGSVINFGSNAGTAGRPGMGAHGAAKEAIRALTKTASLEWGADNIRVNVVCPIGFSNPTSRAAVYATSLTPLARTGTPDDTAAAVVFLAGPVWINGRTLHVDGGVGTFR